MIQPPITEPPTTQPPAGDIRPLSFLHYQGMERGDAGSGTATIRVDLPPQLLDNEGMGHGGVLMTLLDRVMARAALSRVDDSREVVTVDLHICFMRPASGLLQATGRATGGGRSVCFCEGQVVDAGGEVLATSQGTFRYRIPRAKP